MAETVADQENFTYIPLSSFVILLAIILTCASRRKKIDAFNVMEQNMDEDFKKDYAVMCFPCLKKKPQIDDVLPTTDLTDQFEYVVEKYTVRKVPLLLANTTEDIIERQIEIGLEQAQQNQCQLSDNFLNLPMAQEVYNVEKSTPSLSVAPNTSCPGKRALKERNRPTDVLESMSPIPRPTLRNPNYVVIPTKASLRHKDIMITKREITNQYLNNFSSVFVDNLKDQVPKDPERFPSLSRPYTSAIRDLPLVQNLLKPSINKKSKKRKYQKVAYTFPAEEFEEKEELDEEEDEDDEVDEEGEYKEFADEGDMEEEGYDIEEEGDVVSIKDEERYYYSDSESKDLIKESGSRHDEGSEYQEEEEEEEEEEVENDTENFTEKSKSFVLLNARDNPKEASDVAANPFKTTIQFFPTETDQGRVSPSCTTFAEPLPKPPAVKDDWPNARTVTYEDIQSLDVGYEFTSSEKLGVKPKMTRIAYPHENDRLKDAYKQLNLGDTKMNKRCFIPPEQTSIGIKPLSPRMAAAPKSMYRTLECTTHVNPSHSPQTEKCSSTSSFTETSFLPKPDSMNTEGAKSQKSTCSNTNEISSMTNMTTQSEESKSCEMDYENNPPESTEDTVTEITKMYDLSAALNQPALNQSRTTCTDNNPEPEEQMVRLPAASKSRSFQDLGCTGLRKENTSEAKGKDNLPCTVESSNEKSTQKVEVTDTETNCSLSQSKTSSAVTSPRSSEPDEGKRATLRWKIVIKHHRESSYSKKNINKHLKN